VFNPYVKAILLAALAAFGVLATSVDDGAITASEVVIAVAAFVGGLATVWAANITVKWIVSGLVAGLTSLGAALLEGGVSLQEGITIGVVVVTALAAVYRSTNAPEPINNPRPLNVSPGA